MTMILAGPGLQRGMAVIVAAVGVWLVVGAWRRSTPDPIRQALRGHPLESRRSDPFDRLLDRWNASLGSGRRRSSLQVLRIPAHAFRRTQVKVMTASCAAAVVWLLLTGGSGWPIAAACPPLSLALTDRVVGWGADARRRTLAAQVVPFAEYLAMCATAGLTAPEAVTRSSEHVPPPLRLFVADVAADLRTGSPFDRALRASADRIDVPQYRRLCDTVLTAAERGTPLGPALMGQVRDIRSQDRARRMERAGRAEVAMLVPIVLLVLPAVVAVAVYPGFQALSRM